MDDLKSSNLNSGVAQPDKSKAIDSSFSPVNYEADEAFQNAHARNQALNAISQMQAENVPVIDYTSQGSIVILADAVHSKAAIEKIMSLQEYGLRVNGVVDPVGKHAVIEGLGVPVICAQVETIDGYLGAFDISLKSAGGRTMPLTQFLPASEQAIDIVVDLQDTPSMKREVFPPGYFYSGENAGTDRRSNSLMLDELLVTLPDMIGEFDKPKYFTYNPDICVHGRSGKTACTRCIDACPTAAIGSLLESIEVDPHLCQGGGSCAAVCPSGAISYNYPSLDHVLAVIAKLLNVYRECGGKNPRVLFYESVVESDVQRMLDMAAADNVLPLAMEEVGAIGMETTLGTFAHGAHQVVIASSQYTPPRITDALRQQSALANLFLHAMGFGHECIVLSSLEALPSLIANRTGSQNIQLSKPASYMLFKDKRTMIYRALEHLNQEAPDPQRILPLPEKSPFGQVHVNKALCTLCMACASVCPVQALQAGGEKPQLNFIEDNCVQCGLCEQSCPERAITLEQRFVFSATQRKLSQNLNEEEPFACIRCGKPFTTRRMIDHMVDKLAGHWMYDNEEALSRLKMCENCRVEHMYTTNKNVH